MYLEKLTRGQGEAFTRHSKLNAFFGEKQVTGRFFDQLHSEELRLDMISDRDITYSFGIQLKFHTR